MQNELKTVSSEQLLTEETGGTFSVVVIMCPSSLNCTKEDGGVWGWGIGRDVLQNKFLGEPKVLGTGLSKPNVTIRLSECARTF